MFLSNNLILNVTKSFPFDKNCDLENHKSINKSITPYFPSFLFSVFLCACMSVHEYETVGVHRLEKAPGGLLCFTMPHSLKGNLVYVELILLGMGVGRLGRRPATILYSLSTGSQKFIHLWDFVVSGDKDTMLVFMPAQEVHLPLNLPFCPGLFLTSKKHCQFYFSVWFTIFVKCI